MNFPTRRSAFSSKASCALAISGWFGPWWPNFFQMFEFPGDHQRRSVDFSGRWNAGRETTVFVYGDCQLTGDPRTRSIMSALLFIPPVLRRLGNQRQVGEGMARGTFTYTLDPPDFDWKEFNFAGVSSLPLEPVARLIGPGEHRVVESVSF